MERFYTELVHTDEGAFVIKAGDKIIHTFTEAEAEAAYEKLGELLERADAGESITRLIEEFTDGI